MCPCHASSFDITGDVLSPPAPRPLDIFPVRIENDIVKVDTRKADQDGRALSRHRWCARDEQSLDRWKLIGVTATAVIVLSVPAWVIRQGGAESPAQMVEAGATFVGREVCRPCHEAAFTSWQGSDHDLAMDVATVETVLGDFDDAVFTSKGVTSSFFQRDGKFFVNTEGPDGELADFEITHTFGHEPLQQYLVPFPGGRLQCLSIAWDTDRGEWFDLYPDTEIPPDDWLHWTRAGQNWNGMCAECHSTNLLKNLRSRHRTPTTRRGRRSTSAARPATDRARAHVAWAEIQPMARPELADYGLVVRTGDITSREQVELCAPCHSRRSELGDYDHSTTALLDSHLPSRRSTRVSTTPTARSSTRSTSGARSSRCKMYANDVRCTRLPRRAQHEAAFRGQRALPAVPPGRRLRHRRAPLPQEGPRGPARPTARCASSATCPSSPTW